MKALIDLDIPVFTECASAAKRGNPFGGEYAPNVPELVETVCEVILEWTAAAGADEPFLVYSHQSRRNFRKVLLPLQYKAGRATEKPGGYYDVLERVIEKFPAFAIDGVEGDDTCGILHTSKDFGETVTVSTDKDFFTLPGLHYNPMKMAEAQVVTPNHATHFWMWQVLVGDPADGYKGCPKIGKVKAGKILGNQVDDEPRPEVYEYMLWEAVYNTYRDRMTGPDCEVMDAAVMQARMARILHRCDYSQAHNMIRLWHPDSPDWMDL